MMSRSAGLTFVEALVALAVVVALLVFTVLLTRSARHTAECRENALKIAAALRTYASNWNGWSHHDPEAYVKEFGYRLSHETGYFEEEPPWIASDGAAPTRSQMRAAAVPDFTCPADPSPATTKHGIPSSYKARALFSGSSIMNLTAAARDILAVHEVGQRHCGAGSGEGPGSHCVFADLHVELLGKEALDRLLKDGAR